MLHWTACDVFNSYRTCRLNEERAIDRHASQKADELQCAANGKVSSTTLPPPRPPSEVPSKEPLKTLQEARMYSPESGSPAANIKTARPQAFNISTPEDFLEQQSGSAHRKNGANASPDKKQQLPRWTQEEDTNLSKGYQKYGFQWTAITKDPEMHLAHRTGPQVRDRFRLKYPLHYQASIPLPLPDAPKRIRRRRSDQDPKPSKLKPETQGSGRQELTWILRDASEPPQRSEPRLSHSGSAEKVQMVEVSAGRTSFPSRYLQDKRGVRLPVHTKKYSESDCAVVSQSTPPTSMMTCDQSRQSSVEADETRNMNIDDLLNDDSEPHSRLPPFKFPFDNIWSNEAVNDSVTLPPLLWEDMASRPLFELE